MNDAVNDPEILEMLYWHEGLSLWQIAQRLDCSESVVYSRMRKFGIDRRGVGAKRNGQGYKKSLPYRHKDGYPVWRLNYDVDGASPVRVHQLLAIAHGEDPHEVFADGMHIHHKNGVRWDNRPENIELLTASEHTQKHADERDPEFYQEVADYDGYSEEELLEWIDSFVKMFGFVPADTDLAGWPGPASQTYRNNFGSFPEAVRKAGYVPRSAKSD